jgi:hypothetical protein
MQERLLVGQPLALESLHQARARIEDARNRTLQTLHQLERVVTATDLHRTGYAPHIASEMQTVAGSAAAPSAAASPASFSSHRTSPSSRAADAHGASAAAAHAEGGIDRARASKAFAAATAAGVPADMLKQWAERGIDWQGHAAVWEGSAVEKPAWHPDVADRAHGAAPAPTASVPHAEPHAVDSWALHASAPATGRSVSSSSAVAGAQSPASTVQGQASAPSSDRGQIDHHQDAAFPRANGVSVGAASSVHEHASGKVGDRRGDSTSTVQVCSDDPGADAVA